MANEISYRYEGTGATLYATIRSEARQMWNTSGTPALEALTVANWADYDIALAETPASSYFYVGNWPAGLTTEGYYWIDIYAQSGASPAISDTLLASFYGYWDGAAFKLALGADILAASGGSATDVANAVWDELPNRVDAGEVASLEEYKAMTRDSIGMAAADLDTQLAAILAAGGGGSASFTEVVAESYAAAGQAATPAQLLYMILSAVTTPDLNGVVLTTRKLDGTTKAMEFALTLNQRGYAVKQVRTS